VIAAAGPFFPSRLNHQARAGRSRSHQGWPKPKDIKPFMPGGVRCGIRHSRVNRNRGGFLDEMFRGGVKRLHLVAVERAEGELDAVAAEEELREPGAGGLVKESALLGLEEKFLGGEPGSAQAEARLDVIAEDARGLAHEFADKTLLNEVPDGGEAVEGAATGRNRLALEGKPPGAPQTQEIKESQPGKDHHLEHEAIDLRLRQRVGALLLDGILRG